MKLYLTWLVVMLASLVLAQTTKPSPAPQESVTTAKPPALPALSNEDKLAIRDLQLEITQLADQQRDLVKQYQDLGAKIQEAQAKLKTEVDKVFKQAHLDQKDYQVDGQKLVFLPKPP